MNRDDFAELVDRLDSFDDERSTAECPVCAGELKVKRGRAQAVVTYCRGEGCTFEQVRAALGIDTPTGDHRMNRLLKDLEALVEVGMSESDRMLYTVLALFAGDDGRCFPSDATVARATGRAPRSVYRGRKRLEAAGVLTVETVAPGRGHTNEYRLERPALRARGFPDKERGRPTEKARDRGTERHAIPNRKPRAQGACPTDSTSNRLTTGTTTVLPDGSPEAVTAERDKVRRLRATLPGGRSKR